MSTNDNGFPIATFNYTSEIGYITEGGIFGIIFGWVIGVIGLYVLGICLIEIIFKKYYKKDSEKSSDVPRHRKDSSSSGQPAYKLNPNIQKSQRTEQIDLSNDPEAKHKRKKYEQNPTLQMINMTQQNQNETYKKMSNNYKPNTINLDLDGRIDPKDN